MFVIGAPLAQDIFAINVRNLVITAAGDLAALERLFTEDVVSMSDGGGFIRAAENPVVGRERVANYIATVSGWAWSGVTVTMIQANRQACALMLRNGGVVMLFTVDASPEGIGQTMWVMRPAHRTFP